MASAPQSQPQPEPVKRSKKELADETASWQHLLAGATARSTTAAALFFLGAIRIEIILTRPALMMPLDTVKTRLQFQGASAHVKHYKNFVDAFRVIYVDEGIRGFYRGFATKLLYKGPAGAVSFLIYELGRKVIQDPKGSTKYLETISLQNPLFPVVLGATARVVGTMSRTPFDIVKQRMQVQGSLKVQKYSGSVDAAKQLWRNEGAKGLFTGLTASLLRDIPFGLTYFISYELLKTWISPLMLSQKEKPLHWAIAGGGSGFMATAITIPFDVVKTRLQTQAALPMEERIYHGTMQTMKLILKEEGFRGLMSGLSVRLLYLMPATAVTFVAYEQYKRWLGVS